MKKLFLLFFIIAFRSAAQQVYQIHEVETKAEPGGGPGYLGQFVNANLRIPFKSAVKGINARIYLKGIVEPDGRISQVEITRGIDSLCNREAVRVFSLYNAWKPATVNGKKVRQMINYPMTFKSAPRTAYDSSMSAMVEYYDAKYLPTADPKKYEFRTVTPVDAQGYVSSNVVYEQASGKKWKELGATNFNREEFWYKSEAIGVDSVEAYRIGARDRNMASHATEVVFQKNGLPLSYTEYGELNKATLYKSFDLKGMVRSMYMYSDSLTTVVNWFDNGQIANVTESTIPRPPAVEQVTYLDAWDPDGKQLVSGGEGYWKSAGKTYGGNILVEEGVVSKGNKQGKWIGKWTDSTLHYEELYENGTLKSGYSIENGQKTEYTVARSNPQFKGGINRMYQFLGENIVYPVEASRRGVQGRVKLSFTVCEDGSVCDYKVENAAGFGLDDEAMRVVKKMSGYWEPGTLRGKTVPVRYNLPINFEIR